jgi:poly-beta-1,6-N-acetyl-D-glucosamine synthase
MKPDHPRAVPKVSVVVALYNTGAGLADLVASLDAQTLAAGEYEVILVDDGSTDDTGERMASAAAADPRIKVLTQPRAGETAARNLAVRHAAGEVLMFVDVDAALSRWTVDHMLQGFEDPRTGAVSGESQPVRWQQDGLLAAVSHLGAALSRRAVTGIWGLPFPSHGIEAVTSKVMAELGPFRESATGTELELLWRVHKAGYRIAFAPMARVRTASPSTLPALWRRRSHRARGLLHAVTAQGSQMDSPWHRLVLRYERLVPFLPVSSVFTALSMLAGVLRFVRGLSERPRTKGCAAASDEGHDARRALQGAWA